MAKRFVKAENIEFVPAGLVDSTDVQSAITQVADEAIGTGTPLTDHLNDATAAHAASAISYTPGGSVAATNVQAAITEVSNESGAAALNDHLADTIDAHDASAISFSPTGSISSTDVQGAIAETYTEVQSIANANAVVGRAPYSYPIGGSPTQTTTTANNLAAAGGTLATPIFVAANISLESISFWNTDAATLRGPVEFALYTGDNSSNSVSLVASAVGTLATFTPTVAALRTIALTTPPVALSPGVYWLLLKNNHATVTLGVGVSAAGTMAQNVAQTKTLTTSAFGSTLDMVAATWTKISTVPGVRLNGRVFAQASAF